MSGALGAVDKTATALSEAGHGTATTSHVGIAEFRDEVARQNKEFETLHNGQKELHDDVHEQLKTVRTGMGELKDTTTAHGGRLTTLDNLNVQTAREHSSIQTTQANHTAELQSHGTRLTGLEVGRFRDTQPFTPEDINTNTTRIANLKAVHAQDITTFTTGHGGKNRDKALQDKIESDPTVLLQQANLSRATARMEAANKPGAAENRADFLKAAEDAEKSAKDLDAARRTIESTGVFQSGNSFSKYATKINAGIAAISIAAAGTTGGLIAANNETQRQKTEHS